MPDLDDEFLNFVKVKDFIMQKSVQNLVNVLTKASIPNTKIELKCSIDKVSFDIQDASIVGNVIQEWLGEWMTSKSISWTTPTNSQSFPDFFLNGSDYLEVKAYNVNESAAFDVANFKSYIDSIIITPERLFADYIIFPWEQKGNSFYIKDFFVSNVWEITSTMTRLKSGLITHQAKKGTIYNIRPYGGIYHDKTKGFKTRRDFIVAVAKTIDFFAKQVIEPKDQYKNGADWMKIVEASFSNKYKQQL